MGLRIWIAAFVLAALPGCSPSSTDKAQTGPEAGQSSSIVKDWNTVRMELRRGICFGACPAYNISITADGAVSYCGIAYVEVTGERTRAVSPVEARKLFDRFLQAKFFDLRDEYVDGPTDGSMYFVTLWHDGESKLVNHYSGSDEGNAVLGDLEKAMDDLAGSKEWIGGGTLVDPPSIPACAQEPGQPM